LNAPVEPFAVQRAADLEAVAANRRWLVRDLWTRAAVGVVGGSPKVGKSWFALDLAVSVASGTPCLGVFEVEQRGPALVFLAEDAVSAVRERLGAVCASRDLQLADLDVSVIVEPVVRLDLQQHRERLLCTLERHRPTVLLLDPLVRLHRLDENNAQEISGLLGFLREIQRAFDCAVMLVHHTSKKQRARPGMALRGSSDIHAFGDSNVYLAPDGTDVQLTIEHRSASAPPGVRLRLSSRPDGSATHLCVVGAAPPPRGAIAPSEQVLELLRQAPRPMLRRDIRQALRMNNNRLGDLLVALERDGVIRHASDGWVAATVSSTPTSEVSQPRLF